MNYCKDKNIGKKTCQDKENITINLRHFPGHNYLKEKKRAKKRDESNSNVICSQGITKYCSSEADRTFYDKCALHSLCRQNYVFFAIPLLILVAVYSPSSLSIKWSLQYKTKFFLSFVPLSLL